MKKTSNIILAAVVAVFLSLVIVNTATAKNSLAVINGQSNAAADKPVTATTTGQTVVAQKLTEVKLKVCQNKEAAIQKRNDQLTKTTTNMLTKFDSIATRVETYYTDKAVPAGKTVSNYDALIADIAAKKVAVQTNLDKAITDASAFKCSSDDPKSQLTQFRTDMQTVKQSLQDYRTSIKNLIVAIRSATGTTESSTNTTTNQ